LSRAGAGWGGRPQQPLLCPRAFAGGARPQERVGRSARLARDSTSNRSGRSSAPASPRWRGISALSCWSRWSCSRSTPTLSQRGRLDGGGGDPRHSPRGLLDAVDAPGSDRGHDRRSSLWQPSDPWRGDLDRRVRGLLYLRPAAGRAGRPDRLLDGGGAECDRGRRWPRRDPQTPARAPQRLPPEAESVSTLHATVGYPNAGIALAGVDIEVKPRTALAVVRLIRRPGGDSLYVTGPISVSS
jgi:hypothetical protein